MRKYIQYARVNIKLLHNTGTYLNLFNIYNTSKIQFSIQYEKEVNIAQNLKNKERSE